MLDERVGQAGTSTSQGWPTRVLVVDDAAATRRFVRAVLEDTGRFELAGEAVDGRSAIDQAARLQPDVVLLDVSMPNTSATGTLRALRHVAPLARILVLSGMDPSVVEPLLADGAEAHLPKGLAPDEFVERLDSLLAVGPGQALPPTGPPPVRRRLRCAVCDDDPLARHLVTRVLEDCGVDVIAETDVAPMLLNVVDAAQPDIVVLDLWLEGMSGTSALPEIAALSPATTALVYSGHEEWRDEALAAGAAAFVPKPHFDRLEAEIRALVGSAP